MDTTQTLDTKLSAIDKALAAAKARKAVKEGMTTEDGATARPKKGTVDHAARQALKAERDAERALRKQRLAEARAAKRAESGKPAHMKKLERAAAGLPELTESATLCFNEVTTNFSAAQIDALALHLQHFNRVKATERALTQKVDVGASVKIVGGSPKFIGLTGTVSKSQRIRCYVEVPGVKRPVYLFISDVEVLASSNQATGTDG